MTERKPAHMTFDTWVDVQIREAQERGEFDDLPGKGKPLRGLDQPYDELWWVKQWLVREGVSYLPRALALRLEAQKLVEGIGRFSSEDAVRTAFEELNERIREANRKPDLDGPTTTLMPFDLDAVVARWRRERPAVEAELAAEAAAVAAVRGPELAPPSSSASRRGRGRRRWGRRRPSKVAPREAFLSGRPLQRTNARTHGPTSDGCG